MIIEVILIEFDRILLSFPYSIYQPHKTLKFQYTTNEMNVDDFIQFTKWFFNYQLEEIYWKENVSKRILTK